MFGTSRAKARGPPSHPGCERSHRGYRNRRRPEDNRWRTRHEGGDMYAGSAWTPLGFVIVAAVLVGIWLFMRWAFSGPGSP